MGQVILDAHAKQVAENIGMNPDAAQSSIRIPVSGGEKGGYDAAQTSVNAAQTGASVADVGLAVAGVIGSKGNPFTILDNIQEGVEAITRVRHYTNRKGSNSIENDGVIRAKGNDRVYLEPANKKPRSQIEVENTYQLHPGRGRDYVETDVPTSRLEMVKNPKYGTPEMTVKGDLPLKNHTIHRRK